MTYSVSYQEVFFKQHPCCIVPYYVRKNFDWFIKHSVCWIHDVGGKFDNDIVGFRCCGVAAVVCYDTEVNFKDIVDLDI